MVVPQSCRQDSLKSSIIVVFPKDLQPAITTLSAWYNPPASSARLGRGIESV